MSDEDVLAPEEIDALVKGVSSGAVDTSPRPLPDGTASEYNLGSEMRIVRGRMPTLEMIYERFARLFRHSVYRMLRRTVDITVGAVQIQRYGDYMQSLALPTSLNMVKINPLRGTALIVLAPKLVYAVVDSFFGGNGRNASIEGRNFTASESRIVRLLLQSLFTDLKEAWAPVATIDFEYLSSEMNPQFATVMSPGDAVVVTSFHLDFEGGGGDLHVTMPYSMIEPIRAALDSSLPRERCEQDSLWSDILRQEIELAEIEMRTVLGHSETTVSRLLELKPGDVLPCDFNGQVTLFADDIPILRGGFGVSRGQQAIKVVDFTIRADIATAT